MLFLNKKKDAVILHCSTNDTTDKEPDKIVDRLMELNFLIQTTLPHCNVVLSYPTMRNDNAMASSKLRKLFEQLNILNCECIDNSNINSECLGKSNLYLNSRGCSRLAMNCKSYIQLFYHNK